MPSVHGRLVLGGRTGDVLVRVFVVPSWHILLRDLELPGMRGGYVPVEDGAGVMQPVRTGNLQPFHGSQQCRQLSAMQCGHLPVDCRVEYVRVVSERYLQLAEGV